MSVSVNEALCAAPHFDGFRCVDSLEKQVRDVQAQSPRVRVDTMGTSLRGAPIHRVQCGTGPYKVLVVGFPHCHEPIGGMTVSALLDLLARGHSSVCTAELEWHIVPCIDPDGARCNEGWTQLPFSFARYMKNRHVQPWLDQVDCSFPISYKGLQYDQPSREAEILRQLLEALRPDFFFSLHNSIAAGGAWYPVSRDLGARCYSELEKLRERHGIPLQQLIAHDRWCARFAAGIYEMFSVKQLYDDLEKRVSDPAQFVRMGAASWDYLAQIKGSAVSFVAELPHATYLPGPELQLHDSQRQLRLRLEADNRFLLAAILEEWQHVQQAVDHESPYFRKVVQELVPVGEKLSEGVPLTLSAASTRDLLFNPEYAQGVSSRQHCDIYIGERFNVLCHAYEFVRLLKDSQSAPAVERAAHRLEKIFDDAYTEMSHALQLERLPVLACDTLMQVQLGSGLIALNAALEAADS